MNGLFQLLQSIPQDQLMGLLSSVQQGGMFGGGMMQQPTSYSALTRYYSPAANSGMTQSDINNASYDQLVRGVRTGSLIYNDPNAQMMQQSVQNPMMQYQVYTPRGGYGTGMFSPAQTGSYGGYSMMPFVPSLPTAGMPSNLFDFRLNPGFTTPTSGIPVDPTLRK